MTTADSAAINIDVPVQIRRVLSGLAILKPENMVAKSPQFRRGRPLLVNKAHPKPASGIVRRYTNQPSKILKFAGITERSETRRDSCAMGGNGVLAREDWKSGTRRDRWRLASTSNKMVGKAR